MRIEEPQLRQWLMHELHGIEDDIPELASYVVALVRKDKPLRELKQHCAHELQLFLKNGLFVFVSHISFFFLLFFCFFFFVFGLLIITFFPNFQTPTASSTSCSTHWKHAATSAKILPRAAPPAPVATLSTTTTTTAVATAAVATTTIITTTAAAVTVVVVADAQVEGETLMIEIVLQSGNPHAVETLTTSDHRHQGSKTNTNKTTVLCFNLFYYSSFFLFFFWWFSSSSSRSRRESDRMERVDDDDRDYRRARRTSSDSDDSLV